MSITRRAGRTAPPPHRRVASAGAPFWQFLLTLRLIWLATTFAASVTVQVGRGKPETEWLAWPAAATVVVSLAAGAALWSRRLGLRRLIVANAFGVVAVLLAFTLMSFVLLAQFPAQASLARSAWWAYALALALPVLIDTHGTMRRTLERRGPIVARARAEGRAGDAAYAILFGPGRGPPDRGGLGSPGAFAYVGAVFLAALVGRGALFWLLSLTFVFGLSYISISATIAPRTMLRLLGRSDLVWNGATEAWEDVGES